MLNIAYDYLRNWRFNFNSSKSSVLIFTQRKKIDSGIFKRWIMGKNELPIRDSHNHLGIIQSSNLRSNLRTQQACKKGKNAFFAINFSRDINPLTSANLYQKVIIPSVLYGSELWNNLTVHERDSLNRLQRFILKNIQGFPTRTRSDMVESMLGFHNLLAEIDKRKLLFFNKLCHLEDNHVSKQLFF